MEVGFEGQVGPERDLVGGGALVDQLGALVEGVDLQLQTLDLLATRLHMRVFTICARST